MCLDCEFKLIRNWKPSNLQLCKNFYGVGNVLLIVLTNWLPTIMLQVYSVGEIQGLRCRYRHIVEEIFGFQNLV